ncbi:hypothetical protein FNV43_RR00163 [Rhamnella rubrinervis]|uniref:RNase H type-1 domain-containing protein n=1 Tax=Rhamnella rubrinervis TaxID=2594499 RepID=A0A8K0HMJ7_9ROSA|nr:hypothetical protein FNV43_RR00163 [Rhamnella rubrinervis]
MIASVNRKTEDAFIEFDSQHLTYQEVVVQRTGRSDKSCYSCRASTESIFHVTNLFKCNSPFEAEVDALRWASEYTEQCNWRRIEWETDAKEVERAICSEEEPTCWYAYHSICNIHNRFQNKEWMIKWRNRSCSGVADAVAKMSLSTTSILVYDEFSLHLISPCIMDLLLAEQASAAA